MKSKWKPSMVVQVDALTEEFASPEGRKKLLDSYVKSSEAGDPWLIPAEQFKVETVRPLSLQDLAISDSMKLNKQAAAAIVGVPAFMVGVGGFNQAEFNNFINTTVKSIVNGIQQELTKKLILSPKWYIKGNVWSLMDWDMGTVATVFNSLADRGFVTGNEVRDKVNLPPKDGLDELRILENYIPTDMSGLQKKLVQED
jgi:HK97 family phage portal protein